MNIELGAMHAASFAEDPKHLLFVLARYHFVAKLFRGFPRVLEVGCGDGTGAHLVAQTVRDLVGIDLESSPGYPGVFVRMDVLKATGVICGGNYDGAFALDVLEHIHVIDEDRALFNIANQLHANGVLIVGMPSLESQPHASRNSKREHVNCKTEGGLRATLLRHFHNVFCFGLQDATLHVGYDAMAHYRLALCTNKR